MAFTVLPSDLALLLGIDDIDEPRAELILSLATMRAEGIVAPADLPDSALPIVLECARRAYTNPEMATSESVGSYNIQVPASATYYTKAERADLERMVGTGGAFTVNPLPADAGPPPLPWVQREYWDWPA